jgi:lipoic acid synthetase
VDNKSPKKPNWIKAKASASSGFENTLNVVKTNGIHTVCEDAMCPNISECWKNKTATFLIMGNICTRACGFCNIATGHPQTINPAEPYNIAKSINDLCIKHAVITSVTRDDLSDGGASCFVDVIVQIRNMCKEVKIELLTPDFQGNSESIRTIVNAKPDVFGHNLEVARRLHESVKKHPADYDTSLEILKYIKKIDKNVVTKTGIMVGIGEEKAEVMALIDEANSAMVSILTIGQYLAPTNRNIQVERYVHPDEFAEYEEHGKKVGINVIAGPFVRSSYKAREAYDSICNFI